MQKKIIALELILQLLLVLVLQYTETAHLLYKWLQSFLQRISYLCGIGQKLDEENTRCIAVKNYFDSLIDSCGTRFCSNFTSGTSEYKNCVITCKSIFEVQKANAISNSSPYDSNFENKETYIDIIDGKIGAVSYDLSDKTATFYLVLLWTSMILLYVPHINI